MGLKLKKLKLVKLLTQEKYKNGCPQVIVSIHPFHKIMTIANQALEKGDNEKYSKYGFVCEMAFPRKNTRTGGCPVPGRAMVSYNSRNLVTSSCRYIERLAAMNSSKMMVRTYGNESDLDL